jgi:hypothetical protein
MSTMFALTASIIVVNIEDCNAKVVLKFELLPEYYSDLYLMMCFNYNYYNINFADEKTTILLCATDNKACLIYFDSQCSYSYDYYIYKINYE